MKRFIAKSVSLLAAILIVGSIALEANGQRAPKFVKYCFLFDPPYEGKSVSSSSLMFYSTVTRVDGADTFLYSSDCNGGDYFAIPKGDPKVWGKWQGFFDKLQPEKNLTLEIKFEGTPDVETTHLFGSLAGWARAQITFSKILSIRDITSMPKAVLPDHEAAKPNIELIEGMRNGLQTFLQSLYAPSHSSALVWNSLPDDFLFVDSSGKTYTKDQYLGLNAAWAESKEAIRQTQTSSDLRSKTKNTIVYRGMLKLVYAAEPIKTFYCDITFVLRDGDWILTQAKMVPNT